FEQLVQVFDRRSAKLQHELESGHADGSGDGEAHAASAGLRPPGPRGCAAGFSRSLSPSNVVRSDRPMISSVITAGNDSVPLMLPAATALATARSISRCELMPTILRNLRMLRLKVSSSMAISWGLGGPA